MDFSSVSDGKESACNVGDAELTPGLGRSPDEGEWSILGAFLVAWAVKNLPVSRMHLLRGTA